MNKNKSTISDKISALLTAAPKSTFSDDEDDTTAKLGEKELSDEDAEQISSWDSSIRKKNANLLEELDEKYAGKRCNRKDVNTSEKSDSGHDDLSENENDQIETIAKDDVDIESISQEEGSESDDESEPGSENENESEVSDLETEDVTNYKNFSSPSSAHSKKGDNVRNQLQIWESLLEMRIQLQKSTGSANKLPSPAIFKQFQQSPEFCSAATKTKQTLSDTLGKLLDLQKVLLKQFGETKNLLKSSAKTSENKSNDENDEEIPSDTEDELSENDAEEEDESTPKPAKRRKLNEYENDIKETHNKYTSYRNKVINIWNEKTRLDTKDLSSNSVLNQIQHILNDKTRLIRRSQLKKSQYQIIGEENDGNDTPEQDRPRITEEYNSEIYDDDDFYHQLLRELIEVKSADITDPVQLGRQWIQLQNLRSKMKRKIDTKATKGRKIRYTVHNKLVNFMAPIERAPWTDDAKTELFNSIFK